MTTQYWLVKSEPDTYSWDQFVRDKRTAWLSGLVSVLKNRATWPGFFANAGLSGAFFTFAGLWAVPYLTQMHAMSRATASNHVSIYFLPHPLPADDSWLLGSGG